MSRRPKNFDYELTEGESGWTILGTEYRTNPRDLVEPWAFQVVQTWSMCRGEFGLVHLPDQGGVNDQAAWLMEAFSVCAVAEADLRKAEKDSGEDHG